MATNVIDFRVIALLDAAERVMHYRRELARVESWGERLEFEMLDKDCDEERDYDSLYDSAQLYLEQADAEYAEARAAVAKLGIPAPADMVDVAIPPN